MNKQSDSLNATATVQSTQDRPALHEGDLFHALRHSECFGPGQKAKVVGPDGFSIYLAILRPNCTSPSIVDCSTGKTVAKQNTDQWQKFTAWTWSPINER